MKKFLTIIRRDFISGLIIFLPLALTVYLFILTINFSDGLLGKFIKPYFYEQFGFYPRGVSIVIGVLLIILIGSLGANFFGRRIHGFFERMMVKLPFFKQVYPAFKEMAVFLFSRERMAFKQVVLIEYPRQGIYSLGFLTNETNAHLCELTGQELCNIFIPSAPGPLTGYVVMVPKNKIHFTDMPIDDAVRFLVSGGVLNPFTTHADEKVLPKKKRAFFKKG